MHPFKKLNRPGRIAVCILTISWAFLGIAWQSTSAQVNVLTYHNDAARTGANTNETLLTPANVNINSFGKLFAQAVDGKIFAQPLYMTGIAIPGKGVHNAVFVATEHDGVYAFDADNNSGANAQPLWYAPFINPALGITAMPNGDAGFAEISPEVGITGTPVIDPASGTLYVEAKTKEVSNGVTHYVHRLHALDVHSGVEKFGGPALIADTGYDGANYTYFSGPSVLGSGAGSVDNVHVNFNSLRQFNRPGLLLANGIVYVSFGAHSDRNPAHGWMLGYAANTLQLVQVYNSTPNGSLGSIWMSGAAPASDAQGNIFFETGNGDFNTNSPPFNLGNSVVKLIPNGAGPNLILADYFAPYNLDYLNAVDGDFGSAGVLLLPDSVGSAGHPHLLVASGKVNQTYLLDRDNLGHFNAQGDQVVQALPGAVGATWTSAGDGGGIWSMPAYFNKLIFYNGSVDVLKAFQISDGQINPTPVSQSPPATLFNFPGATPSISANGTNNAIAWALKTDGYDTGGSSGLHAYDAYNLAHELYNSDQAGSRDLAGGAIKFTVPTIANGKVYVGTANSLTVYGNGFFVSPVAISPAGGGSFYGSVTIALAEGTPGLSVYYTLDGATPTTNSFLYSDPFVLTNGATITAEAFYNGVGLPDSLTSTVFTQGGVFGAAPPTVDLKLWLRADAGVITNAPTNAPAPVLGWTDQAPGSLHSGVPVAGATPTLQQAPFPNGVHPVIVFDGSGGLNLGDAAGLELSNLSLYVVGSVDNTLVSRIFISCYQSVTGWAVGIDDSQAGHVKWFSANPNQDTITAPSSLGDNLPALITATFSNNAKALYINSTPVGSETGRNPITYAGSEFLTVGYLEPSPGGAAQNLVGNIAEIIAYSPVDPTQKSNVEAYLNAKYFTAGQVILPATNGMVLWLRADAGVTYTPPNPMYSWRDQSPAGLHNGTQLGSPALVNSSFPNGQHPVMRLNGSSGFTLTQPADLEVQNLSIYMVGSVNNTLASRIFISCYEAVSGWAVGIDDSQAGHAKWFSANPSPDTITAPLPLDDNTPTIVTATFSNNTKVLYINSAQAGIETALNPIFYSGKEILTVGYLTPTANPGQLLNGDIAEILVYDAVNNPQHAAVEAYLKQKYFLFPTISIQRSGNQLTLSWIGGGFILQQSSSLMSGWSDISGATNSFTTVTINPGSEFFRLRSLP